MKAKYKILQDKGNFIRWLWCQRTLSDVFSTVLSVSEVWRICRILTEIYRLFTLHFWKNRCRTAIENLFESRTWSFPVLFLWAEKFFFESISFFFRKLHHMEYVLNIFSVLFLRRQHVRLRHTHFSYIISLLRRHGIFQAQDFFLWPFARVCRPDKREKRNH